MMISTRYIRSAVVSKDDRLFKNMTILYFGKYLDSPNSIATYLAEPYQPMKEKMTDLTHKMTVLHYLFSGMSPARSQ